MRPRRFLAALAGLLLVSGWLFAQSAPDPTPTPRPRLTGGFGRTPLAREEEPTPEATPAAEDAPGSSLTDVVKAASDTKAKKDTKARSGVSITNQTLVTNPQKGRLTTYSVTPLPTPSKRPAGNGTGTGESTAAGAGAVSVPASPQVGDETYWRQTARSVRGRVEELKIKIAELDAAAKRMENDFYAWDDGQYRDRVIKPAWDKTREELETSRQELIKAEQDLADLPDRARKAGVPPGWLRE